MLASAAAWAVGWPLSVLVAYELVPRSYAAGTWYFSGGFIIAACWTAGLRLALGAGFSRRAQWALLLGLGVAWMLGWSLKDALKASPQAMLWLSRLGAGVVSPTLLRRALATAAMAGLGALPLSWMLRARLSRPKWLPAAMALGAFIAMALASSSLPLMGANWLAMAGAGAAIGTGCALPLALQLRR